MPAAYGHEEMVEWLLDEGANLETRNFTSWSALYYVSHDGHVPLVFLLLGQGRR